MAMYDQQGNTLADPEALGAQLDAAKKAAALLKAPGLMQEKAQPGSLAAYQAQLAAHTSNIADLQSQYERSLNAGAPIGFGALAATAKPGGGFQAAPLASMPFAVPPPAPAAPTVAPAPPLASPAPTAASAAGATGITSGSIPSAVAPAAPAAPVGFGANNQPYQPVMRTVGADGTINITGSGTPAGYGAKLNTGGGPTGNPAGDFMGALIGLKQISGDNAITLAKAKQATESLKAGSHIGLETAQAAEAGSKGAEAATRAALAAAHLRTNPGDYAGAAAITMGRVVPQDRFTFNPTAMPDASGRVQVLNTRQGGVTLTTPKTQATEQHIKDVLSNHPEFSGSRAKAIAALKDTGRYTIDGLK